jgi:hypothetical protein
MYREEFLGPSLNIRTCGENLLRPLINSLTKIVTKNINLKLELGIRLIAMDHAARRRLYEQEGIERPSSSLSCHIVRALVEEGAPQCIAILSREKHILCLKRSCFAGIARRKITVAPRNVTTRGTVIRRFEKSTNVR